MDPREGIT